MGMKTMRLAVSVLIELIQTVLSRASSAHKRLAYTYR